MSRLLVFMLLIYTVSAINSCITQQAKEAPDIRVIELDDSSKESNEAQIVALHLPNRRKRESHNQGMGPCKKDEDCSPGTVCITNVACVKGTWRTIDYLKTHAVKPNPHIARKNRG